MVLKKKQTWLCEYKEWYVSNVCGATFYGVSETREGRKLFETLDEALEFIKTRTQIDTISLKAIYLD